MSRMWKRTIKIVTSILCIVLVITLGYFGYNIPVVINTVFASPDTQYAWINAVPKWTDDANYAWINAVPYILLEAGTVTPAIVNAPATWTINGITGSGTISPNTTYYSNPGGDTVAPTSANVTDGECRFTITNSSTMVIDLTVNFPDHTGGDASTNNNTGNNTATQFGAYSYFSGLPLANKVIAKNSGSAVAYSGLPATTNIKWGLEYKGQSNIWGSSNNMTSIVTITATAH